ncbi:MAG: LPS assembly lipoprotein LptE [Opitutales bacterium]
MKTGHHRYFAAALAAVAVVVAGCAHYALGDGSEPPFDRVWVAPVQNQALVPRASAPVTGAIRDRFLQEPGKLALADQDAANAARLEVVLTDFSRRMITTLPTDTGRGETFQLVLDASVTLRGPDGEVLFRDRPFFAATTAFALANFPNAEYQALPVLAKELADKIHHAVNSVW